MKKNSEKTDDTDGVKKDDEEQSQRFIDKAREIGCPDSIAAMNSKKVNSVLIGKK